MSTLNRLSAGLPLGDGATIPWFIEFHHCESLGGKLNPGDGVYRSVDFGERMFLNELRATVSLSFYWPTPEFQIRPVGSINSEVEAFNICFGPTVTAFGPPTKFAKDEHYPSAFWKDGPIEVKLGVGNRFTDYFTFSISHEDWRNDYLNKMIRRRTRTRYLFRVVLPIGMLAAITVVAATRCAA